jgi:SpoVK/Ycf46/Vps4 family AAA+-type ATPase
VLAAALAREIWRVDLSQLAGDSVGETEQNLESLLTRAEQAGAVLLFEECEALFGSGTAGGFEAERLLRRLEAHPGVTILELRGENEAIDEALRQRARAVVQFPRWRGRG